MIIEIILILLVIFLLCYFEKFTDLTDLKKTAIIVEPREHLALELVLKNFTENLDDSWGFIVFHGNKNIDFVQNIINKLNINNRVKLVNLNINNLTIDDYNNLFYNETFYSHIPTEIFLVFQTDTFICKKYKNVINKFLKYDYVGAPWDGPWSKGKNVGNGGLSLRRKSKMLELLKRCDHKWENNLLAEDIFFSNCLNCQNINVYKPSFEEAKEFSMETIQSDNSFGIHKYWIYGNQANYCDNIEELLKFQ